MTAWRWGRRTAALAAALVLGVVGATVWGAGAGSGSGGGLPRAGDPATPVEVALASGILPDGRTFGRQTDAFRPDLIVAYLDRDGDGLGMGEEGTGLVARTDLDGEMPRSPVQAQRRQLISTSGHSVPAYAEDGLTVIGTFLQSGTTGATDPRLVTGAPPPGAQRRQGDGVLERRDGCVYLVTAAGTRWLILPWGVHADPGGSLLEDADGHLFGHLGDDVTLAVAELPGQVATTPCGAGAPPLYALPR